MILLTLFLTFFKIGLLSFGGGMGMLPLMEQEIEKQGWMTSEMFVNFIALSESTPGPIAVNIATFIGHSQAGILGGLCATVGVVTPAFIVILCVAMLFRNFAKNKYVKFFLKGLKPVTLGLILGMGISMIVASLGFSFADNQFVNNFDYKAVIILGVLTVLYIGYYKWKKKSLSPILMILVSAGLGISLYLF